MSCCSLTKAYESNRFFELAYALNGEVVNADVEQFNQIFEAKLLARINEKRNTAVESAFQYKYFKDLEAEISEERYKVRTARARSS